MLRALAPPPCRVDPGLVAAGLPILAVAAYLPGDVIKAVLDGPVTAPEARMRPANVLLHARQMPQSA